MCLCLKSGMSLDLDGRDAANILLVGRTHSLSRDEFSCKLIDFFLAPILRKRDLLVQN